MQNTLRTLDCKCINIVSTKVPVDALVLTFVFYQINFSSPLEAKLGDVLNIKCPPGGTSNIWIQVY